MKYGFKFDTTYLNLPECFFSKQSPSVVPSPKIIILNNLLADSMGLDVNSCSDEQQAELFSGNKLPVDATPFSQAYAGHQFGHFTMLGDGRAVLWGEHLMPNNTRVDIQFKGSGRTPYSRRGDGKATLGPMLREYIISEAMHYLGIPTTRSLAVATTGEDIARETMLPGATLTRVASSYIRVGSFEFAAYHNDNKVISAILNYTIQRHYPDLLNSENRALSLLEAVMEKQADLIVNWMKVGFIHGVMNTDNMLLCGETIDYGPCAFIDSYNPDTVFSSIDDAGRYAYANQPNIAQWNLARLAETLLPLIHEDVNKAVELAEHCIKKFSSIYKLKWLNMMRAKLGLSTADSKDEQLISDLLKWMQNNAADYTNTFRDLSYSNNLDAKIYKNSVFEKWYQSWQDRLKKNIESLEVSLQLMKKNNPVIIPRNHKVEQALEAAYQGNFEVLNSLLSVLKNPYNIQDNLSEYSLPPKSNERVYQTFCGT